MSEHVSSAFRNACRKTPINPVNHQPSPIYERQSSADRKHKHENSDKEQQEFMFKADKNISSLVNFYDSIPDYKDVIHLSKAEFDAKLESLKRKQCELNQYFFQESSSNSKRDWNDEIKSTANVSHKHSGNDKYVPSKNQTVQIGEDYEHSMTPVPWAGSRSLHKSASKSVRINSAKSNPFSYRSDVGGCGNLKNAHDTDLSSSWLDLPVAPLKCRSKSASPFRSMSCLTVPKPFKMTQREEEEAMLEDLLLSSKCLSPKEKPKSNNIIKANPVPITSKVPLYKEIVASQEHKNQLAKLNSAIELQSQMKPFTFTEKPDRCKNLSASSPQLSTSDCEFKIKNSGFRAKPFPRNFFSNNFYHRMWEDDYFRSLNRKLRSEELLRKSSLPPSMRKRDQCSAKSGKSERSSSATTSTKRGTKRKKRCRKKVPDYCHIHDKPPKTHLNQKQEFITTCPDPFEFETEKRSNNRRAISKPPSSVSQSSKQSSPTNSSPMPLYPAARPNLAANLRVEWAQKKLNEMSLATDTIMPREKFRRPTWGVRRTSAWKSLYYDNTNDEDISLRLATRRAEQKLRQEEHQISMELMRQRVKAAPLLLEGPTYWGPKVGHVTHSCASPLDRHKIGGHSPCHRKQSTKGLCGRYSSLRNHSSKLSNYSDI